MVFTQNSSIFHWAVHQPIDFFQVWSHTRRFEPLTEELYGFLYDAIFSSRARMRTNHLATKCNYYEIRSVCGECLKKARGRQRAILAYEISGFLFDFPVISLKDDVIRCKSGWGWFPSLSSRKSALISHDFNLLSTDFSTKCTRFLSLPTPRIIPNTLCHLALLSRLLGNRWKGAPGF